MNEPISFDAEAFLDLTGGEQAALLRSMQPIERIRLATNIAVYFRSAGFVSYASGVMDGFYSLMSLREGIAGHAHITTQVSNAQIREQTMNDELAILLSESPNVYYVQRGNEVYRIAHGSKKYYCTINSWPTSKAVWRSQHPRKGAVSLGPERNFFNGLPNAQRVG